MTRLLDRVPHRVRALIGVALFGVGYYLLSKLGISLVEEEGQVAVLWPASGLSLAVFALAPRRWWPALAASLFTANTVANYLTHGVAPITFQLPVINTLEPIIAASLLLWITGKERRFVYGSSRGVAGLLAAATVANAGTALLGAWAINASFGASYWAAFSGWWIGDGLGMLAVAPLIFAWGDRRRGRISTEGLLLVLAAAVISVAVLYPDYWGAPDFFNRGSVLLPILVWTAIRALPRITSAATLVVAIVLTLGTLDGRGPFVGSGVSPLDGVANLQFFLAVAALLPLMVEGVLSDRRAAQERLSASTASLESVLGAATEFSIIGTDPDGNIDVFNTGAERLLGRSADEMIGRSPAEFHDPGEVGERAAELGIEPGFEVFVHAARLGEAETRQWTYIHADGSRLQVSLTVTARVSQDGRLIGFMGIARDVTESVRIEAERAALLRTSRAVAAAEPLETTLNFIAAEVGHLNGAEVAAVTRFESPELGTAMGGWSASGWLDAGHPINLSGDSAAAFVSRSGDATRVAAEDAEPYPSGPGGPQARVGVPVIVGGSVWGAISMGAEPGADFRPGAEDTLGRFADLAGLAVTNDRSREEVERKRDELSAIIDGLPALVWVQDLSGSRLISNRAFEVRADSDMELAEEALFAALADPALDADALETDETITVEQSFTDGSERERTMLVARSRLVDAAGTTYALSCVATDITERREMEQAKDQFIGVVSHELRTPLSSIRGALSLLSEDGDSLDETGRQRMIEIASSNSERLVALINDILDIQRIESGATVHQPVTCDSAELIGQAVDAMTALAAEKRIAITAEPESLECLAEPGRIVQVLSNFLSNAVKFSPENSRIDVGCEVVGDQVGLYVRDQGRGIPPDMLEAVFDRFQQVDSSDSRDVGGTGLGLAICREIADQHGGRVWAESEQGVGSCFWVSLPPARRAPAEPDRQVPSGGATVLICDDDPSSRSEAREMVESLGFVGIEAASAEVAVSLARSESPEVVLLDLVMPGEDGFATLAMLAEDEQTAEIPVVMMSALAPDSAETPPLPVADWITKPATVERLLGALSRAHVSPESGHVLVVEDDAGLAGVLMEQLRRDEIPAVHARTGREAIRIASQLRPHLIVLDVGLPEGDGFDVVDALRSQEIIPEGLIIYSAFDLNIEDRQRLELGRTDFVTKSRVSPGEFHQRLAAMLPDSDAT